MITKAQDTLNQIFINQLETTKTIIMNNTLIKETDLINIKSYVYTIEGLESLKLFSKLTPEEEIKLIKTQKKLFKLIKTL